MLEFRYLLMVRYSKRFYEHYFFNDYDEMLDFLHDCGSDIEYVTYFLEKDLEGVE